MLSIVRLQSLTQKWLKWHFVCRWIDCNLKRRCALPKNVCFTKKVDQRSIRLQRMIMQRLFQNLFHLHAAYSKILGLPHADDVTSEYFLFKLCRKSFSYRFSVLSYHMWHPFQQNIKKAYLCGNLNPFMIEHKKILMKTNDKELLLLIDLWNNKMH